MDTRYSRCIQACQACALACNHCAAACLREPGIEHMTRCIALDMDCAAPWALLPGASK